MTDASTTETALTPQEQAVNTIVADAEELVEKYVAFPTGTAAPSISIDASGTPHLTVPLTKKTKAHIGTAVAGITVASEFALQFVIPGDTKEAFVIKVAIGVVGIAATWLGIALPTNLPLTKFAAVAGKHSA